MLKEATSPSQLTLSDFSALTGKPLNPTKEEGGLTMVTAELNVGISVCFQHDFIFLAFSLCCMINEGGIFFYKLEN